jgi:hypothetical protein
MSDLIEKLRWRIVALFNRLPGQCWADLVSWVLAGRRERREWYLRERLPWRPIQDVCRKDLARVGCCYCGKLRTAESTTVQEGHTHP